MGRRRRKRRTASGGLPWLIAGMVVGAAGAGIAWWLSQPPAQDEAALEALLAPQKEDATPSRTAPSVPPPVEPEYDFYHLLPRMEVVIPEEELSEREKAPAHTPGKPAERARYLLQVGAFRTLRQADELKARLALLGFEAHIERIDTDKGTWHRVRLGPFTSLRELDRTRNALRRHHIEGIPLKVSAR